MIYIKSFKNYDEFKQIFGVVEHGNGAKSRKNKILLACLKDRKLLKWWLEFREQCLENKAKEDTVRFLDYLYARNMDELKRFAKFMLGDAIYYRALWNRTDDEGYKLAFDSEFPYILYSPTLCLDKFKGLCVDGDTKSIRYVNTERNDRVFKMKAGKFISKCIEDNFTKDVMPEQLKRWIGEEFAREWQSHAEQYIDFDRYTLHVDDNFMAIYDSERCKGDFGSCMTNTDCWSFYRDTIDCKAAYLTDEEGDIVARCIVYQTVYDEDGCIYRLAERQYSFEQNNVLKQLLVDKLIKAGEIDGYKRVGADCHDNRNFVTNSGESMKDKTLHIKCYLEPGDTLSYQDSFVFYDLNNFVAYNNCAETHTCELDTTSGVFEWGCWSEYNNCYISEDDAVYDDYYEDWVTREQLVEAVYRGDVIGICDEQANEDTDFVWSIHEYRYIYKKESVYDTYRKDYVRKCFCVEDVKGNLHLSDDCTFSLYCDGYILDDDRIYCRCVDDYVHKDDAVFSSFTDGFIPKDKALHSEITCDYYFSEEDLLEDEKKFSANHALVLEA